jgi:hypothetical protein
MLAYAIKIWRRVLVLLNLQKVVNGATFDNLTIAIVCFLIHLGGILGIDFANKVVCFIANHVIILQGLKTCVIVQLMNKHNAYIVGIHCMTHQCNLVVQTLSSLFLVAKI